MLLQDWATDAPTPPYYEYLPSLTPHPFMGLGKFFAGRIYEMRAAKGPPAAHPSGFEDDRNPTCPRCRNEPETFRNAIPICPARSWDQDLLLKDVSSIGQDAALWSAPHRIPALGEYITHTKTGFPPEVIPNHFFPPSLFSPPFQN